ncbi:CAP domain-containing protein [Nocardioides szechwanensis]|nr:CAP domain-containing protein [Nocardioides szechwanensis]
MLVRLIALLAAAILLLVATPAVAATPTQVYASQIMSATNTVRINHDRPKLQGNACVKRFAVRQAQRMANQERIFHQRLGPVLRECGLTKAGENVAYGFPTGLAVVFEGWLHSPSHLVNILDREFRLLGAGARKSDSGVWYAAQVFGRR